MAIEVRGPLDNDAKGLELGISFRDASLTAYFQVYGTRNLYEALTATDEGVPDYDDPVAGLEEDLPDLVLVNKSATSRDAHGPGDRSHIFVRCEYREIPVYAWTQVLAGVEQGEIMYPIDPLTKLPIPNASQLNLGRGAPVEIGTRDVALHTFWEFGPTETVIALANQLMADPVNTVNASQFVFPAVNRVLGDDLVVAPFTARYRMFEEEELANGWTRLTHRFAIRSDHDFRDEVENANGTADGTYRVSTVYPNGDFTGLLPVEE